uniref:G2/mitotic-specific cyclin-B2 n=1 Tax=Sphaeramia orbicularis TaxID=375764 RepID=A0A672YSQ6_9TELE
MIAILTLSFYPSKTSLSTNAQSGNQTNKENDPPPSKITSSQIQRTRQRTVLGVLSENEQYHQSLSQGSLFSKHSSISESSQLTHFSRPSSSSDDMYVEEACEVVLASSGQEVVSGCYYLNDEAAALNNEDVRFLLELSSSSGQDASIQSEFDEPVTSEGVLCVSEYAEDIYWHMRETELKLRPQMGYLVKHPDITNGMRVILVDWMVEVMQEFRLCCETLHLAVNYLNRFLSRTSYMKRSKLQLLGTAALMIAAKHEEIFPPDLSEFVDITNSTYTKQQLIRMEHAILKVLSFRMAAPTVQYFLRQFMLVHLVNVNTENLALYVADLSLLEVDPFVQYTPSQVAAAAYCLANYTVNKSLWPDTLQAFTGYTMADFVQCMNDLHILYKNAENLPQQTIREKYSSSK